MQTDAIREIKAWGIATHVFTSDDLHVSVAEAISGGSSSTHLHEKFDNIICVISGSLRVDCGDDRRYLSRGDLIRIPAGELHSFFAESDSVIAEVYVPPGKRGGEDFRDIQRQ